MDHFLRDLRHALRSLARSPGFTAVALVTLALGTGANAAIFSVVHGVLLEPLPFADPDRLVTVWLHNPRQGFEKDITSYPNFRDWREQGSSFSQMVAVSGADVTLSGGGAGSGDAGAAPEEVRGALVMAGFFAMLGVEPELGRGFRDEEHEAGHHEVVVLSHGLWSRRFAADPGVVGSEIRVSGRPHTVVGVMPPGVRFPEDAQLWLPFAFTPAREGLREARSALWLPVYGRLAPAVSLEEAQAEMSAVARRLEEAYPDDNQEMGILLEPLQQTLVGEVERPLLVLLGAVGLVLLIACADVANLLLARGAASALARLIRRVYEVDPLLCQECGGTMRILAFILEPGARPQDPCSLGCERGRFEPRASVSTAVFELLGPMRPVGNPRHAAWRNSMRPTPRRATLGPIGRWRAAAHLPMGPHALVLDAMRHPSG
jgi:predicted permease